MKKYGGWNFPDHEQHLINWLATVNETVDGRLRYQGKKQDAAMLWVKNWHTAVDIGGHVGLHSYYLAKQFEAVHAFEPVAAHRECFAANIAAANVTLHACALGDHDGSIAISTETGSSGNSFIKGDGDIPLRRLDDFDLQDVSYIKLDCEGAEWPALRGGEETIKRCKPCIMVEQKKGRAQKFGLPETGAVAYLQSLGAKLRTEMSGDFVLSFD